MNATPDGYRWICMWNSLSVPSASRTKAERKLYSIRQDAPKGHASNQQSRVVVGEVERELEMVLVCFQLSSRTSC